MAGYKDYRLSPDTSEEAERLYFELLRKKSVAEKLQMVSEMNATVRTLTMSGLRERFPDATEQQLKIKLAELLHGKEFADVLASRLKDTDCSE